MLKLFITFFKIGLFTFGGGYAMIPLISEEIESFGIDPYTFSDFIAISESTPGPFAINISTFIGYSSYGILGSIVATFAVTLPSLIIMLIIAIFIKKFRNTRFFKTFLTISTPIILGLILSSSLKITNLNLFNITNLNNITNEFKLNLITIISLFTISLIYLIFYIIKKKRISPFSIIGLSFICGLTAYFINLF